jgi:hypothetical protein
MVTERVREPEPQQITAEEGRRLIDERARRFLGVSGVVFEEMLQAGELSLDDDRVARVAMLLPLGR